MLRSEKNQIWGGHGSRQEVLERWARTRPGPGTRAIHARVPRGIRGSAKDGRQGLRRIYPGRGSRSTRVETCLGGWG